MRRPWQLIVVRSWPVDDRRIIRLTLSTGAGPGETVYVASAEAAGEQLRRWLEHLGAGPSPGDEADGPDVAPVEVDDPDEGAAKGAGAPPGSTDGTETVARRTTDGPAPTVPTGGELG